MILFCKGAFINAYWTHYRRCHREMFLNQPSQQNIRRMHVNKVCLYCNKNFFDLEDYSDISRINFWKFAYGNPGNSSKYYKEYLFKNFGIFFFFLNCLLTLTRFCVLADSRSSHQRCFVEKGVLKNFVNFTAKHLCLSLFSIKLKTLAGNFIKKRLQYRCFPMKFAKILRTPILKNICERLLLRLKNICLNSSVIDMQLFPK